MAIVDVSEVEKIWSLSALAEALKASTTSVLRYAEKLDYVLYGRMYVHKKAIPIIESAVAALLADATRGCATRLCTVSIKALSRRICRDLTNSVLLSVLKEAAARVATVNKRSITVDKTTIRGGDPKDVEKLRKMMCGRGGKQMRMGLPNL